MLSAVTREERIEWIDCAKGITILLVIIGHTVSGLFRGIIFSFHMPLFFILSCYTYHFSINMPEFRAKVKKSFVHLVFPAMFIFTLRTMIEIVGHYQTYLSFNALCSYLLARLLTLLYASGVPVSFGRINITEMGMPWFLIVLFLGRCIFDYMHMKLPNIVLLIVSVLMSIVRRHALGGIKRILNSVLLPS